VASYVHLSFPLLEDIFKCSFFIQKQNPLIFEKHNHPIHFDVSLPRLWGMLFYFSSLNFLSFGSSDIIKFILNPRYCNYVDWLIYLSSLNVLSFGSFSLILLV